MLNAHTPLGVHYTALSSNEGPIGRLLFTSREAMQPSGAI
jgi:hypothetical protein